MKREFNFEKLFLDVFNPKKGEVVLIMYDVPKQNEIDREWSLRIQMAEEWFNKLKKMEDKFGIKLYPMIKYNATYSNNALLPDNCFLGDKEIKFDEIFSKVDIILAMTQFSATAPLIFATKKFNFRAASMPGVSKSMERTSLAADYKKVAERCSIINNKLKDAEAAEVIFNVNGNKLNMFFDLRNRVSEQDDGICWKPKTIINLPSGETFIVPYEGESKSLGPSKTKGKIPFTKNNELVIFEVNENKIIGIDGKGKLFQSMTDFFGVDDARRNLAELGIGCNEWAIVSGSVLEDEKVEGIHIAYGLSKHLGGITDIDSFKSKENVVHRDMVYPKNGNIKIESMKIIKKNKQELLIKDGGFIL